MNLLTALIEFVGGLQLQPCRNALYTLILGCDNSFNHIMSRSTSIAPAGQPCGTVIPVDHSDLHAVVTTALLLQI